MTAPPPEWRQPIIVVGGGFAGFHGLRYTQRRISA
jgi:hypothetical protein